MKAAMIRLLVTRGEAKLILELIAAHADDINLQRAIEAAIKNADKELEQGYQPGDQS